MNISNSKEFSGSGIQTVSIIAGKIIALIATFAMPLFLTRYLSKNEYGIFSQFSLVLVFCTLFFSLGIQSNLYYFYPTSTNHNRKSLILLTLLFLILFSLVAIGFISVPIIEKYLLGQQELINYKGFIIIGIIFLMPINIIEPLYVIKKDNITSILYPPIEVIVRLSLVILLAIYRPGLNSIFIGILISAFACLVFTITYSLKDIKIKNFKKTINCKLAKQQIEYSLPFGLAVSLNTFAERFDKIICISFLTPATFATYSIAFYGIPGVQQVYNSLSQIYLIKMTVEYQKNNINQILAIYKFLVTKTYSFSLPAILIVSLYAEKIIVLLFTTKYIDAVPLFRVYLLSILIYMLGSGLILRATGKTINTLKSYIISCIITIPSTFFFIKYQGIWGAMLGALISIILPRIIMLFFEIRLLKSNLLTFFPWKNILDIFLISIFVLVPFVFIEIFFNSGILLTFFLGIIYFLIVSMIEIKYKLFVFENISISNIMNKIVTKYRSFKK